MPTLSHITGYPENATWLGRAVIGPPISTAEVAPLHLKPIATPTGVTAAEGDMYWDSTAKRPAFYDGTSWHYVGQNDVEVVASGDKTVTAEMSGRTFVATAASGTQTFTLPAAVAGLQYTFICGHASGEILINVQTGDEIKTMAFSAIGADADTGQVAPAAGTGIKNTAATNVVGDAITLIAKDGTTWFGKSMPTGIWASQ